MDKDDYCVLESATESLELLSKLIEISSNVEESSDFDLEAHNVLRSLTPTDASKSLDPISSTSFIDVVGVVRNVEFSTELTSSSPTLNDMQLESPQFMKNRAITLGSTSKTVKSKRTINFQDGAGPSYTSRTKKGLQKKSPLTTTLASEENPDVLVTPLHTTSDDVSGSCSEDMYRINLKLKHPLSARQKQLVLLSEIRKACALHCCSSSCLGKFSIAEMKKLRQAYFEMSKDEQNYYLCLNVRKDRQGYTYFLGDLEVCRRAFKIGHAIGNSKLERLHVRLLKDSSLRGSLQGRTISADALNAKAWLTNFVKLNAEQLPNSNFLHLPDNFTKFEIYMLYKDFEMTKFVPFISYSYFIKLWKRDFGLVKIPRKSRMSICSTCEQLKLARQKAECQVDKENASQALKLHREQQTTERLKLAKHRKKCLENPSKYIALVIDGMDQKKTLLPHFVRVPKNLNEADFIQVHLVGALVFHGVLKAKVFFNFPTVRNDPNLTITIIHKIILELGSNIPEVLYLQLDNTARENKNKTVLAYLAMLVNAGIFKKIKVGFLLVGHTHDQIDQMFSCFSKKLRRKKTFSLPSLQGIVEDSYTPKPVISLLQNTFDFREYIKPVGDQTYIEKLNDISFQHQFKLKNTTGGTTLLWGKAYSNSTTWLPEEGVQFLKSIPTRLVPCAPLHPLVSLSEEQKACKENRDVNPKASLNFLQSSIQMAFPYFEPSDICWWENFFTEQQSYLENPNNFPTEEFRWPSKQSDSQELLHHPEQNLQDYSLIFRGEEREIYIGARRSKQRIEAIRSKWSGNIDEIEVGSLVAVLATENSEHHPFWLAKVVEKRINQLCVHWMHTSSKNAFSGRYVLEMLQNDPKGKRKKLLKNRARIDVLNLEEIDLLAFNFTLTTTNRLRKTTIGIIQERIGPTRELFSKSKKATKSNIENFLSALEADSDDNIPIDSSDEDRSSTSGAEDTDIENLSSSVLRGVSEDSLENVL